MGRRYWPTVSTWTWFSRSVPSASTISSKDLAQPDHQPGLGRDLVAAHLLGVSEDPAGALERRAAPRERVKPGDDLDVVVEHVGAFGDHLGERHLLAAEVGRQHLDLAASAPGGGSAG